MKVLYYNYKICVSLCLVPTEEAFLIPGRVVQSHLIQDGGATAILLLTMRTLHGDKVKSYEHECENRPVS